ncbi:MAG: tail fiber protein [Bacteroidota bacterium]
MNDGYIGEIRMFAGNFAPSNWYFCNGQLIQIVDNQALFAIISTLYGGDGRTTMALPDFRGVFPMSYGRSSTTGTNYNIGQRGGNETTTLTQLNLPAHSHPLVASNTPGNLNSPQSALLGNTGTFDQEYVNTASDLVQMSSQAIGPTGNGQSFSNMSPYLAVSFIICHTGTFPSRS